MACYLSNNTLFDVSNQLRIRGKNIVLTHGSFDLFHIGHMELLKQSKKLGDYLIVGVDSDERVSKYKNVHRPIIPFEQRIELLLENKSVDFVLALDDAYDFSEKYYLNMSKKINPNFITFGKNFGFVDEIQRRQKTMKNCKFIKISHQYNDVQSTTNIINKITQSIIK